MKPTVTIIGSGYVGLTTAAVISNAGYKVYALDVDKEKVETINSGKSYFFEVGLDGLIKKAVELGDLKATTSYEESIPNSDIVFSCVGTPDNKDGSYNMSYIYSAAEGFVKNAKENAVYVQKSTVPVGTGCKLKEHIQEQNPNLEFTYVSNPEFLREGSALFDTLNMDRVVVGSDDNNSLDQVVNIYRDIAKLSSSLDKEELSEFASMYQKEVPEYSEEGFDDRVVRTNLASAELIKVTANSFLALKISFAIALSRLCDKTGAKVDEVFDGAGTDNRISRSFFYPSIGWGGGCFPKDVSGLIAVFEEHGLDMDILDSALEANNNQTNYVVNRLKNLLGGLKNKKATVLGLSFKAGTSDVRKSKSIKLANELVEEGCRVSAYDPKAMEESEKDISEGVDLVESAIEAVTDADVVIIATEWPEFKELDFHQVGQLMSGDLIFDGRNILDKESIESIGLKYIGIGR